MYWETLNFTKKRPIKSMLGRYKYQSIPIEHGFTCIPENTVFIGVDPGVNFGITVISTRILEVAWGKLPKILGFVGMESAEFGELFCKAWELDSYENAYLYVEGPAFNAQYGQTKLEQVRFGFVAGMSRQIAPTYIHYIAPASARKVAFGDGKKSGKDIWININENGADSIGVALACMLENL